QRSGARIQRPYARDNVLGHTVIEQSGGRLRLRPAPRRSALAQSLIHYKAAGDRELSERAGQDLLRRRMDVAPRGEPELAERAVARCERGEEAGQADRRVRTVVEGQEQQFEMGGRSARGRSEAGDRRQHLVADGGDDLLDLAAALFGEERGKTSFLHIVAK